MARFRSVAAVRISGVAGVAGGLAWAALPVLWFVTGAGASVLGHGALDALAPATFALALAGVAGYRARAADAWGLPTTAGFGAFAGGLVTGLAGSVAYLAGGLLAGWTLSVWGSVLALVGATVFGAGLLVDGARPRVGAVLLAATLPVGVPASLALAVSGVVGDEAIVPVGPGVLLGLGVVALGRWVWTDDSETA